MSAILWYNNIDEALVSLGYKPSHKFITKSGINNGSMMLKSRMGNSLRFVWFLPFSDYLPEQILTYKLYL